MNLVDSSGWLEYFADGPNAEFFAPPIEDTERLLVPTICVLEVFKRVMQQRGEQAALQATAIMQQGHLVGLDVATAMVAAKLGLQARLPLADSVVMATARAHNAVVWTQDANFEGLEDVRFRKKR